MKWENYSTSIRRPDALYAQLERAIRFAIATERLRVGDQLPTVRQLAVELRINANTVAKVYAELERAGVVETRRGVGTFVRERVLEAVRARRRPRAELAHPRGPFCSRMRRLSAFRSTRCSTTSRAKRHKEKRNHG